MDAILVGMAAAEDNITLRYSLTSWENGAPSNSAINGGATTVSRTGYVNWTTDYGDIANTGKGVANLAGNGHFYIAAEAGIEAGGTRKLNTTDGFSLVFNGYAVANWADFLSIKVGDIQYKIETGQPADGETVSDVYVYTPDGTGVKEIAAISNVSRNTWYNYALTAMGTTYTFSVWDSTGKKVSSDTFTGAGGTLLDVYEGARFSQHWYGGAVDNFGLYDGVLSDAQLEALVKSEVAGSGMIQSFSVPEPTTATLSLLALAGLAARRRRK